MNNQTIINIALVVGIIALFVLFFAKPEKRGVATENAVTGSVGQAEQLPVAFVNLDSLLVHYNFAVEANEKLINKQEDARLKLNTKARTLQNEMNDFQRKYENNAFLSRERAENEYQKLQKKQQDLQELEQKLTQDILAENQALNLQFGDSLSTFLKDFNADGRFHIIFSNTSKDNILTASKIYDITQEVIDGMNKRYSKNGKQATRN